VNKTADPKDVTPLSICIHQSKVDLADFLWDLTERDHGNGIVAHVSPQMTKFLNSKGLDVSVPKGDRPYPRLW